MEKKECQLMNDLISPVMPLIDTTPKILSIEVTTRCQLNCVYCTRDKNAPQDLSLDHIEVLKNKLIGVTEIYICGIGESFCYPKIYELVWALKNYKISIITNGAVPIDYEKLNRENNVKLLVFSIDATTAEKMSEICPGYNFNILKENLARGKKYPKIAKIINTTLNETNINEVTNLVHFAAEHKLLAVNFELPIGNEEFVRLNKDLITANIKEAVHVAKKQRIVFNQFYRLTCNTSGSIIANIRINGDVFTCCNGMNKGDCIGNIYQSDFINIWNTKGKKMLHNGDYCRECNLTKNLLAIKG